MCYWLYWIIGINCREQEGLCLIITASHHSQDLHFLFMITVATAWFILLTVYTDLGFK